MFKILVLIIAAVSIFFWYPASGDPIQKDVAKPAPQHTVQQPSEHSQATVFLLSLLPPKQEWPDPVQKIWLSLNIEEAVQERTNDHRDPY